MKSSDNAALKLEFTDDNFAVITFDQPGSRANTMGQGTLAEFEKTFAEIAKRCEPLTPPSPPTRKGAVKGVILQSGKPGMFIAGADLNELGQAENDAKQTQQTVKRGMDMIAGFGALPCPTIALIDGACMGGGTELALGFDYRLAGTSPKVNIGLPEVKVGIIPGWGGTQRLTRVIGPALAAELICSGDGVNAEKAAQYGIVFDVVPSERMLEEGKRLLDWSRESGDYKQQRQKKQQPVGLSEDQLEFTAAVAQGMILQKTKGQLPAPLAALQAIVKGCNLPLEEGLKVETEAFSPLLGSPISKNLIAVFFMNTALSKDVGVEDRSIPPRDVQQVGVLGAGLMGSGIAGAMIRRGVAAAMIDEAPAALEKGIHAIANVMQSRIAIGRMTQEQMLGAFGKLTTAVANKQLMAGRDVVIEAIVENEAAKVKLFNELQSILADDTILASNTSTISITRMAEAVKNPERFAGMHFFNPVDRMRLVEVIRGEKTSDETVVTLVALAKKIGKTPIVVRDCPGFLVNRILFPYLNEAMALLEEGAEPRALDKAAEKFGLPMGPITLNDLVGLDTSLFAGNVVGAAFPDRTVPSTILGELVKAGRLGKKTGAGFYSYAKSSRGADDPAFAKILARCKTGEKEFTQEELIDRMFLPMLTEASRVLSEGIVRTPADVDMGLILGIGFPAHKGGLLRWADSLGMDNVLKKLAQYEELGHRFAPTEQMKELAEKGHGFFG